MAVDQYNCHHIVLANGLEQKPQVFLKIQKCKELTNLPKSPFYTGHLILRVFKKLSLFGGGRGKLYS